MRLTIEDRFIVINGLIPKKSDWLQAQIFRGVEKKCRPSESELMQLTQRQEKKLPMWDLDFNPEAEVEFTASENAQLIARIDRHKAEPEGIAISWVDTILKLTGE